MKRKSSKHPDQLPGYHIQIRRLGQASQSRTFDSKTQGARWAHSVAFQIYDGLSVSYSKAERTTAAELLGHYAREITRSREECA
ncbi:MAG: hypothetical protein ACYCRH_06670 [Acidiferrobacteraceae bacterium]